MINGIRVSPVERECGSATAHPGGDCRTERY
jgi:hypothetical protein